MEKAKRKQKSKSEDKPLPKYWVVVARFSLQAFYLLLAWGIGYLAYALITGVTWRSVNDRTLFGLVCSIITTGNFVYLVIYLARHNIIGKVRPMLYVISVMLISLLMTFIMFWMVGLTIGVGMDWWV